MLLCPAVLATLLAAAPAPAPPPIEIPYQKFVLDNGLTLIVHEDHKAPIVAVNVWYHVGSKNEKAGRTGFAHLFEHLMFNGSEHYNDDYFKGLQKAGATDLNGTTNSDRTNYFQNVPTSALDLVLFLESDRMGHLLGTVDQARLDEQRGVVQNEKRQGENRPYGLVYQNITEHTYPAGHPYSWTVIGSMADLDAAKLDDVREWFKTYYGAANAVVVLAGDIDAATARKKVEQYFGHIPSGPPLARHEKWIARMSGTHRGRMQDRVPQARLYKVWNVPEHGAPEEEELDLLAGILATGKTSRLYKRLVYDEKIATEVTAGNGADEIGGQFIITATAQPGGDLAAVEKAIDEELARLVRDGPTADELARAKTEQRAVFVRGIERIGGFGGKSDILARGQVYAGRPDFYKTQLERNARATVENVQRTAAAWLNDGAYVLEVHPFPTHKTSTAAVDRKSLPVPPEPPAPRFPAVSKARLSNGIEVMIAERTAVPLVNVTVMLDAGYAADPAGKPGTSSLAVDMLDEGTVSRTALQISDERARLGASLTVWSTLDSSFVGLQALQENLAPSLALLADVVRQPAYPPADFERLRKIRLAEIKRERVTPQTMLRRVVPELLFGRGHAYAVPLSGLGTEEAMTSLTRDEVVRFHKTWFTASNARIVVVGAASAATIVPLLEKQFGTWAAGPVTAKNLAAVAPRTGSAVYLVDRPDSQQSMIAAALVLPPTRNPKEIAFGAMNYVLGSTFTSRINMNLREDKHWSYGARTQVVEARGPRPWLAYAPVQTDKTKESLLELRRELTDIISARPVTEEELVKAKDNMRSLPGRWETNAQVALSLTHVLAFGLPLDYYDTYAGQVQALTLPEVAGLAKELIPADRLVWVVVGDRAKIEAGVRELNLGPLEILDVSP